MSAIVVRRASIAAALFAITACSGGSSLGPVAQGGPAAQSIHRGTASFGTPRFVHAGVPFLRQQDAMLGLHLPGFRPNFSTKGVLLYEGDSTNQDIQIYDFKQIASNPAPLATITDGILCPYGSALDSKNVLYVASNCGRNTVTTYKKGQTSVDKTYTTGISNPLGVVIDSKDTLYVANYPAAITEYPKGKTSPSVTITSSDLVDPFGLALDSKDNLYIADFGTDGVYEVAHGTTTVVPLGLTDLTEPLNLAFDKKGNLWVTDGSGNKVNVYPPGQTSPSQSITAGYTFPYQASSDGKDVVTSNISSPVDIFAYKTGTYTSFATLTNDIVSPTGLLLTKH
jgi:sugar lactone lactonase YvrE